MAEVRCSVCSVTANSEGSDAVDLGSYVECPVCGNYHITDKVLQILKGQEFSNRYILSGFIRRAKESAKEPPVLTTANFSDYMAESQLPRGKLGQLDLLLLYVDENAQMFGAYAELDPNRDYPVAFARNPSELEGMLEGLRDQGWIDLMSINGKPGAKPTVTGWARIDELRPRHPGVGNQCFVAMWFDEKTQMAYDQGIWRAVKETGYEPRRIDKVEHNDKIDDRIIAEIRQSRLLVADFTGNRGGVYFEAGFAMGLGIPVIWTCHKDWVDKLHFDTRQYNHIVWESPGDLREGLQNRIRATQPLGPAGST
ncbi:MAG: nucleoside 2-deoxyribosyltransferase [Candidatus Marsarchaeota archaeon]|nr:nucleoside 2-deoxyribosyltransferase [Candidatus Marsarchaeota archaeon]